VKAPVAHDGYGRVAKRLLGWGLGLFALWALVYLPLSVSGPDSNRRIAKRHLQTLRSALDVYRRQTGNWPAEDSWIQQLIDAGIMERDPVDPWDRQFQYTLASVDGGELSPRLFSLGRDGVAGTDDDVISVP
jgi:Type II secretion system (T2SS), protein G